MIDWQMFTIYLKSKIIHKDWVCISNYSVFFFLYVDQDTNFLI